MRRAAITSKRPRSCTGGAPAVLGLALCLAGCASPPPPDPAAKHLRRYAQARCLQSYIEKHGWDSTDVRAISIGMSELGTSPPHTYLAIDRVILAWRPDLATRHPIDLDLLKCFYLNRNKQLEALIATPAAPE